MFANLTGWHFLVIALVVLLIFGATRLPALARGIGQATKIFKHEIKDVVGDMAPATPTAAEPTSMLESSAQK